MKKAKLMLSALGVVAVLASAFAFSAPKFDQNVIYTGTLGSGVCTTPTSFRAITSGTKNFAASTTSKATNCPDERVIILDVNQ